MDRFRGDYRLSRLPRHHAQRCPGAFPRCHRLRLRPSALPTCATSNRDRDRAIAYAHYLLLASKGFKSVAADGFETPGVVACYTTDVRIKNGSKFVAQDLQFAAGVPLQCDEPADFQTLRLGLGLFRLDKLGNIERTVAPLEQVQDKVLAG